MADEEVATKAPESDAVEQSPFPSASVAQEGPSMGVILDWLYMLIGIANEFLRKGTLCYR
jgi:hypothetical protein